MISIRSLALACATSAVLASSMAVAATPVMWASDFSAPASGAPTPTAQGGLVYGYSSAIVAGGDFSFQYAQPIPDTYNNGFGLQEGSNAGTPNAYFGIAFTVPKTGTTAVSSNSKLELSGLSSVLVRAGNYAGSATTLTVVLANGKKFLTQFTDPGKDSTATAVCSANLTLPGIGGGAYDNTYPGGSAAGVNTFAIPLSSFSCSKGKLSSLMYGVTVIGVQAVASASNPSLQVAGGNADLVVQYISLK